MTRRLALVLAGVVLSATPSLRLSAQSSPLQGFDDYVKAALKATGTPGVAIAVVRNDSVVFAKGYGVRRIGLPAPVDEKTVFAIGSETKAFTATALAMLVDEGRLRWDDPVSSYLKGFALADPLASRDLTVRDLLSHRTGLPGADELWYGSASTRGELLARVRFLKARWSFRSRFEYQNLMYLAAGEIVPAVTGKTWDAFVADRIFRPLGMTASTTSASALEGQSDLAVPHERIDGKLQPIGYRDVDNVGPAGSINSTVTDMAQWIRLQLGGRFDGKELVKPATLQAMHTPQMLLERSAEDEVIRADSHLLAYGMGWFIFDYGGRMIAEHGGGIDGMTADLMLVPEENLGVVVLSNAGSSTLPSALAYRVVDAYLGRKPVDRVVLFQDLARKAAARADSAARLDAAGRRRGDRPTLPLDRYVGSYADSLFGDARVSLEDGKLLLRLGKTITPWSLEPWHGDLFRAGSLDPVYRTLLGRRWVRFAISPRGTTTALEIEGLERFERR